MDTATIDSFAAAGAAVHVLVFPYPAQGHMIPILDLTHELACRGVAITVLVTPKNLPLLRPLLSSNHRYNHPIQTLVLPFPGHPNLPAGFENVKDLPVVAFMAMMCALGRLHDPLLRWFAAHPDPPAAIISDMFLGWTHRLADQLGIRRLVLSPSGAFALSVIESLWARMPKLNDHNDQNQIFSFPEVPNSPDFPWWQLSTAYRSYVAGDPDSEFIRDGIRGNRASWGLVVNSFTELERVYLEHLKTDLGHDRVWALGPLLPPNSDGNKHDDEESTLPMERGGSSSVSVDRIKSWLDAIAATEDHTVVYVCFGSHAVLTNDQMAAVAAGLEHSGARFIWSVKSPTIGHVDDQYGMIPNGFEDRVAGRGMVIKGWAPQVVILNHRAVGGFLTHCGWNSVLESVTAGVPMLAWPMGADQFTNAKLLVDQLQVGVRVCEGAQTVPDPDELAKVVVESVGEGRRERAARLREEAVGAVGKGGSSAEELDLLVDRLVALKFGE